MSDDPGGQGDVPPRSDVKLIEQALRNDWPIPSRVKRDILQTLVDIVADPDDDDVPPVAFDDDGRPIEPVRVRVPDRTKISAARALLAAASLNIKQQALDLMRRKYEGKKGEDLADLVAKAEALAEERERSREADRPAGEVP